RMQAIDRQAACRARCGGAALEFDPEQCYSACSHSAAPRQSVSRCSGRKKPIWPIFCTSASFGEMLTISGFVAEKPEQSSSTAVRVAQGSSVKQIARSGPL